MSEIKPRDIEASQPGATYLIPYFEMTDDGLKQSPFKKIVQFVKGDRNNPLLYRQKGYMTETLLELCRLYLTDVSKGHLKDEETELAIQKISEALQHLEQRANKRKVAGVLGTYKETPKGST